jgi:hypothetical protein
MKIDWEIELMEPRRAAGEVFGSSRIELGLVRGGASTVGWPARSSVRERPECWRAIWRDVTRSWAGAGGAAWPWAERSRAGGLGRVAAS